LRVRASTVVSTSALNGETVGLGLGVGVGSDESSEDDGEKGEEDGAHFEKGRKRG